jgi:uncharacterized protein with von Willebrand factor type A (vWA) domain
MSAFDPRALLRIFDELLWTLRRDGIRISTAQAIDAVRAVRAVGLEERSLLREALAAVLVLQTRDRATFDRAFDRFFGEKEPRRSFFERLALEGFTEGELDVLRAWLRAAAEAGEETFGALAEGGAELTALLESAGVRRALAGMSAPSQVGFFAHRVQDVIGLERARATMGALEAALRDALGDRGDALAAAVRRALDRSSQGTRAHVERVAERAQRAGGDGLRGMPLAALSAEEVAQMRRAVRSIAERLRGAERVRRKRARRGRFDPHRTFRRVLATGGVPFAPARRRRRPDRARLVVLCDVSDSVRHAASFLLELVWTLHDLFERTRSFVFVSDVGETTDLFERGPVDAALVAVTSGAVVTMTANSSYGRALRSFRDRVGGVLDRRTTLVVLGDGRTNFQDDGAEVLRELADRVGTLLWLCPEPRAAWARGDSAMARYAPYCTDVLCVRTAAELEDAARAVLRHRR